MNSVTQEHIETSIQMAGLNKQSAQSKTTIVNSEQIRNQVSREPTLPMESVNHGLSQIILNYEQFWENPHNLKKKKNYQHIGEQSKNLSVQALSSYNNSIENLSLNSLKNLKIQSCEEEEKDKADNKIQEQKTNFISQKKDDEKQKKSATKQQKFSLIKNKIKIMKYILCVGNYCCNEFVKTDIRWEVTCFALFCQAYLKLKHNQWLLKKDEEIMIQKIQEMISFCTDNHLLSKQDIYILQNDQKQGYKIVLRESKLFVGDIIREKPIVPKHQQCLYRVLQAIYFIQILNNNNQNASFENINLSYSESNLKKQLLYYKQSLCL